MTPPRIRCPETGKKQFSTAWHARIRALSIERHNGHPLYTYQCPHCEKWHLTKSIVFTELIEINLI